MFGKNTKTYSRNCGGGGSKGEDGERGYDGNSSLWKAKIYEPGEELKNSEFYFNQLNLTKWEDANSVIFSSIDKNKNNLTSWFLYLDFGDILTIRNEDNHNDVAHFRIDEEPNVLQNGNIEIKLVFINKGLTEFLKKNKLYYVGYVKTGPTKKSYNFGVNILPVQESQTGQNENEVVLKMSGISFGNAMSYMDDIKMKWNYDDVIGWIYNGQGGLATSNFNNNTSKENWSDRSSLPTQGYLTDTNSFYANENFISIDSKLVFDKFTDFSWLMGPFKINYTLVSLANPTVQGLAVHIVHIPKTSSGALETPANWNFIRIVLGVSNTRSGHLRLDPVTNTNIKYYTGNPSIPFTETGLISIVDSKINVNPGDGLGVCIFSNSLIYNETHSYEKSSTNIINVKRKISPISFSIQPRINF
jgi:hypothetical protein